MEQKKSKLQRFFTLLFTDRDIEEDFEHKLATGEEYQDIGHPLSEDWSLPADFEFPETHARQKLTKNEPITFTPEDIGPASEEIETNVIEETEKIMEVVPIVSPLPSVPSDEVPSFRSAKDLIKYWSNESIKKSSEGKNELAEPEENIISPEPKTDTLTLGLTPDGLDVVKVATENLRRHMLVVGMTGSGKTTLLERMILQDVEAGRGVGLIDPHGDLYERILRQIPKSRSNDVVLFDLTDVEYPIGFNILENTHEQFPSLIASSIVGVFKKIFGYSWGPRLEYILRNATLTLIERPGSTLLDLALLLSDEDYRRQYLGNIKNPFLQKFWSDEFANMSSTRQAEVVSPILNKVGQFLSVPLIRNIVSQPQSGFSPRWVMDNKKIFLANLSKGKIGEDVSEMLGSLLVSKFQLDVMSRASIDPENRTPYTLYVDEFQNFATESFADIFSEARKYGLGLVIAHQYTAQVNPRLMDAILGNVGNMALFHMGSADAKLLAPNMGIVSPTDLSEQPLYHFTLKTTENNTKKITRGELIPPALIAPKSGLQNPEKLQSLVREKFAKKREFVEGKLENKII